MDLVDLVDVHRVHCVHPRAEYWFDHHPTTFLSEELRAQYRPSERWMLNRVIGDMIDGGKDFILVTEDLNERENLTVYTKGQVTNEGEAL